MKYWIAGGGCYGSYYVRQLYRAKRLGKIQFDELVVIDKEANNPVSKNKEDIARIVVSDWCDIGQFFWENQKALQDDMWVPTPIGPHILFHWVLKGLGKNAVSTKFGGKPPELPFSAVTPTGSLVLSHAPGLCPVNCVEPKICPLTKSDRDWEMKDTVRKMIGESLEIKEVAVFVCQHYAHGVGTIPMKDIFAQWNHLRESILLSGSGEFAVATVSSCHGIVDTFSLP